jgi:sn-glycerol 3-phosphate transport system permease protein
MGPLLTGGAGRWRRPVGLAVTHAATLVAVAAVGFPFFYMIATSFKRIDEVYAIPLALMPRAIDFANYVEAWTQVPFGRFTLNSLVYTICLTVGEWVMGLTCGYAFARLQFPGRNLIFGLVLLTFMIPSQITLVPRFVLLKELGWINTYPGLIVPELASVFATFLFREHFRSLPEEIFDAAKIDGAGAIRQLVQIALPMSVPIATTLLLLGAVAHWNDYLWPLIVTNTADMRTLPIGIQALKFKTGEVPQWNVVMAGATMTVLPLMALFLVTQRKFVEGAVQGALKG